MIIYFDNAASTKRSVEFVEEYIGSLKRKKSCSDKSRILFSVAKSISDHLGVNVDCISFVPNATFALNEVSIFLSRKYPDRQVCLSNAEHSSNHVVWMNLFRRPIVYFDIYDFSNWIPPNEPSIVSISSLTNLEGIEISVDEIEKKSVNGNILVVDASQMIQHKIPNLKNSKIDFLVFSAHKFFGPNGIGVIYSRKPSGLGINYIDYPEKYFDYSLDFSGLEAWSKTIEKTLELYENSYIENREKNINRYFIENFPKNDFIELANGNTTGCIFLLKLTTDDISAHDYAFYLAKNKVIVRSGLSCSWISSERFDAKRIIRVSLNHENSLSEIDYFFDLIKKFEIFDCF